MTTQSVQYASVPRVHDERMLHQSATALTRRGLHRLVLPNSLLPPRQPPRPPSWEALGWQDGPTKLDKNRTSPFSEGGTQPMEIVAPQCDPCGPTGAFRYHQCPSVILLGNPTHGHPLNRVLVPLQGIHPRGSSQLVGVHQIQILAHKPWLIRNLTKLQHSATLRYQLADVLEVEPHRQLLQPKQGEKRQVQVRRYRLESNP